MSRGLREQDFRKLRNFWTAGRRKPHDCRGADFRKPADFRQSLDWLEPPAGSYKGGRLQGRMRLLGLVEGSFD